MLQQREKGLSLKGLTFRVAIREFAQETEHVLEALPLCCRLRTWAVIALKRGKPDNGAVDIGHQINNTPASADLVSLCTRRQNIVRRNDIVF